MRQRLLNSFLVSLEWRAIAFVITNLFLWVATGTFWQATLMTIVLQAILLVTHFVWYFIREEQWHPAKDA